VKIAAQNQMPKRDDLPWSALQRAASQLETTPEGLVHLDGVRWDIENNADGTTLEQGVFRDAYVQPDKVQDVFLCIKPFTEKPGGVPGHALLKFAFPKDAPVRDSLGNTDSALALSVEVHFKQGQGFDPTGGQEPQPILYQLGTWTDAIEKATVHDRNPLRIYKLKLTPEQKVSLLRERLQAATADHTQDLYHPVTNSCLSTLIDGVNKVVPGHQQIPRTDPNGDPEPQATIPVWSPNAFRQYRLLAPAGPEIIPAAPKP